MLSLNRTLINIMAKIGTAKYQRHTKLVQIKGATTLLFCVADDYADVVSILCIVRCKLDDLFIKIYG